MNEEYQANKSPVLVAATKCFLLVLQGVGAAASDKLGIRGTTHHTTTTTNPHHHHHHHLSFSTVSFLAKYRCVVCCKNFRQLEDLRRHTRTHTGEKPYVCPFCDHRSTQLGHLKDHAKRRHNYTGKLPPPLPPAPPSLANSLPALPPLPTLPSLPPPPRKT